MALLDLWWELYRKAQKFGDEIAEILTLTHISYINHRIARRATFIREIYEKKNFQPLTAQDYAKLQGFPDRIFTGYRGQLNLAESEL